MNIQRIKSAPNSALRQPNAFFLFSAFCFHFRPLCFFLSLGLQSSPPGSQAHACHVLERSGFLLPPSYFFFSFFWLSFLYLYHTHFVFFFFFSSAKSFVWEVENPSKRRKRADPEFLASVSPKNRHWNRHRSAASFPSAWPTEGLYTPLEPCLQDTLLLPILSTILLHPTDDLADNVASEWAWSPSLSLIFESVSMATSLYKRGVVHQKRQRKN